MHILHVSLETAAILAEKGPMGRSAKRELAHKVGKASPLASALSVFDSEGSFVCLLPLCSDLLSMVAL